MNKYFIITIDTEGDDQWAYSKGISVRNARYIPRFQELCEKYKFMPVWLTNYEMALDPFYIEYMQDRLQRKVCEIGMHLHAWNNPPEFPLKKTVAARDYLIEYPTNIMEEKIKVLTGTLEDTFQRKMVSHRSGRWALNNDYLKLLHKYGYKIDCSVTPYVNWFNSRGCTGLPGSDYSQEPTNPYYIYKDILEVPVSIRKFRCFQPKRIRSIRGLASECKRYAKGSLQWLRPDKFLSEKGMLQLIHMIVNERTDYLMFMLHSSEMMPGGSPSFNSEKQVDELFYCIELLFDKIQQNFSGITLERYSVLHQQKGK